MRISDWSSDVCSSDLRFARRFEARGGYRSGGRKARPMNTLVVRPTRVRTAGVRQQILLTAQQRLLILMLLFMAAFLVLSVPLLYFALFHPSFGRWVSPALAPAPADNATRPRRAPPPP